MPAHQLQDDGFTNNEVRSEEEEDEEGQESGEDSPDSDFEQVRRVMNVPGPTAENHELRKALAIAQKAYTDTRAELRETKKKLFELSSAVSTKKRGGSANPLSTLDRNIVCKAKKWVLFYHFWLPDGVFSTTRKPGIDPCSPSHFDSPENRRDGAIAELYQMVPNKMHGSMETYSQFNSIFRNAAGTQRSSILKGIKDFVAVIFAEHKLDPTLFIDQDSPRKKENQDLLRLLKHDSVGNYECMAPVLYKDPQEMLLSDFLKSPVLVRIARVLIFGKSVLSQKKRGCPPGRGQRMGIQSVTEGLITGSAILACFVLSHDPELSLTRVHTGINYQDDYDYYLEVLFECNNWALEVMDLYNREVFGKDAESTSNLNSTSAPTSTADSRRSTRKGKFLEALKNSQPPPAQAPNITISSTLTATATSPPRSPESAPEGIAANAQVSSTLSINPGPVQSVALSTTSQLQLGLGQMSISGSGGDMRQVTSQSGSRKPSSRRPKPAAAQPPVDEEPPTVTIQPVLEPERRNLHRKAKK
ncbi:hypothetical protein HYDPIDRAFT_33508 [Hydnomerulius pinastri MD-312]|uniref:Uncharacterized protein n=1 Tax=Hydnomerulius pinastri MD-312 TaxID=994086 RepID=A0A0C9W824_9AGAM|nr:hypothetical protein HYDPIDRAFT_33508 [Hydnomerulius pinastri MD-312]